MASKETPQSIGRYKSELEKSKKRRIDCAAEYPEEWNQLPLTRKHAESFDSKPVHYFNAKRCPKNHLERKFTSNGKCVRCSYLEVKKRDEKIKEHKKLNPKKRKKPGLQKTTAEHANEVEKLNKVILIGEYIGARNNTDYLCLEHHEIWPAMPTNVLKGRGLRCCKREKSGNEPFSNEAHIEQLEKLGRNFELVGNYLGSHKRATYKCKKHQKVYEAFPHQIIRGSGLKCCRDAFYKEVSSKTVKERRKNHLELIKKYGKVKLLGKFKNATTRTKYFCLQHKEIHFSTPAYTSAGRGLKCCQNLGRSNESYRQKKELEHIEYVKQIGKVEFVGPYVNSQTPTWYKCLKHKEKHKTSPNNISQGKGLKCCKYQNLFDFTGGKFEKAARELDENIKGRLIRLEEYQGASIPISFECLAHNEVHKAWPASTTRGHGLICCLAGSTRDNLDTAIENNLPNKDEENDFYIYRLRRFPKYIKIGLAIDHLVRAKRSKNEYGDPIKIWRRKNRIEAFFLEKALLSRTSEFSEAPRELFRQWEGWTEIRKIDAELVKAHAIFLVNELEIMNCWEFALEYIPMNPRQQSQIEEKFLKRTYIKNLKNTESHKLNISD
tara:strand:- start:132 stop:1952 length:1821 start_codon:yes stop_codon:yes gene_type:complete